MRAPLIGRAGTDPVDVDVPRLVRGTPLVEADGLRVERGGRLVLDDAGLVCRAGEVVALVGPNGAGKSTLLGAVAGDIEIAAGRVHVHGAPLGSWHDADLARRRAVLLQQNRVGFPFTVEQVVTMGRAPWQATPAEDLDETVVAAALVDADVAHLRNRRVNTLSGGESGRVALARLLAQQTQLVLADEPTAALDLHHQEHTMVVLRRLADADAAVVVVLHDLGLAAAHADRIVVIDRGRIVADGPPAAVLDPTVIGAVYQHPVDVLADPRSGAPLVVPHRTSRSDPHPPAPDPTSTPPPTEMR